MAKPRRPTLSGSLAAAKSSTKAAAEKPSIPEGFFAIGSIGRPHGLKGALRLHFDAYDPADYVDVAHLTLFNGRTTRQLEVADLEFIAPTVALVQLLGITSPEAAQLLTGQAVILPTSALPPLGPRQWYYHEVMGFTVVDATFGTIGTVVGVIEMPAHDALRIAHPSGAEVLVPVLDAFLGAADRAQRTLAATLPQGLLDVYLQPDADPAGEPDADPIAE